MEKHFFTSDLHFGHANILKYYPKRLDLLSEDFVKDIEGFQDYFIEYWNKTVNKQDHVYILGDFSFKGIDENRQILFRMNGHKHLIIGNHDSNSYRLVECFTSISQMKEVRFKKSNYDFLEEDIALILCHYPILSWNRKQYGSLMIHGHCHGTMDEFNKKSNDLRVDVGIDSSFGNYRLLTVEDIYQYFKNKTNGAMFDEYVSDLDKSNRLLI